jgi:hypothetical protein
LHRQLLRTETALLLVAPHVGLQEDQDTAHCLIVPAAGDTSPPRLQISLKLFNIPTTSSWLLESGLLS